MGKYAAKPGCAICASLGELCMDCALEWRMKHMDQELKMLRAIAGMAESVAVPHYPGLERSIARWRAHRRVKPRRKKKA